LAEIDTNRRHVAQDWDRLGDLDGSFRCVEQDNRRRVEALMDFKMKTDEDGSRQGMNGAPGTFRSVRFHARGLHHLRPFQHFGFDQPRELLGRAGASAA
jgi:hypothetical protein